MTAAEHRLHSGLSLAGSQRPLGGAVLSSVRWMQRQEQKCFTQRNFDKYSGQTLLPQMIECREKIPHA